MDRRVTPPKRVTSPTWGPPPPCKQAQTSNRGGAVFSPVSRVIFCENLFSVPCITCPWFGKFDDIQADQEEFWVQPLHLSAVWLHCQSHNIIGEDHWRTCGSGKVHRQLEIWTTGTSEGMLWNCSYLFLFHRELKQRRRQRHKNVKNKSRLKLAKQQLRTCITLFRAFLYPRCTTARWNGLFSRFLEHVDTIQRFSNFFLRSDTVL